MCSSSSLLFVLKTLCNFYFIIYFLLFDHYLPGVDKSMYEEKREEKEKEKKDRRL